MIADITVDIHAACAAPCSMKMVESHPEGWSQGRCFHSAASLNCRLTWMPSGTLFCDHRPRSGSTRVSFLTNRHLASHPSRVLCIRRGRMQIVDTRCAGLDVHKKTV